MGLYIPSVLIPYGTVSMGIVRWLAKACDQLHIAKDKNMFTYKRLDQIKQRQLWVVLSSLFFYLFAHGYRLSNNMYSHDSLLEVVQDDSAWQIALGRFMHPILIFLRGGIGSPWLIGCCSFLWLSLAVYLITELFQLRDPLSIALTAGIVICNPTLISANAAFLQLVDFYSMALALSILGVYLCHQKGLAGKVLGILSMTVSMGIYQSYICVSITLFMLCILLNIEEQTQLGRWMQSLKAMLPSKMQGPLSLKGMFSQTEASSKKVSSKKKGSTFSHRRTTVQNASPIVLQVMSGVKYCGCLLISAGLYYMIWKQFQRIFNIWTADTYNGMASVGVYNSQELSTLPLETYRAVLDYFLHPEVFVTMTFHNISLSVVWIYLLRVANALLLLKLLWDLFRIKKAEKTPLSVVVLDLSLVCLLPLGMNLVYLLSKGMEHTLMIFSFQLFYLAVIVCSEKKPSWEKGIAYKRLSLLVPLAAVIWCSIVYANQAYLKKSLQEEAAASLLTRIMTQVEQMEDYVPGTTPVAFSGYFTNSPYLRSLPGFEEITPYGMGETSLTYMGTDYAFLKYELNILINETRVYADDPVVSQMPVYPKKGSIAYVDGVLVVKISE